MKASLLYVDDELENLKVFERVFKKDFQIFTSLSGEEGLNILEKNPSISLLVSDQRMPGMSGVDFLNACKHIQPDAIRILITGYADLESTINAINDAEIYRFVKKPWERLDLKQSLLEAQKKYDLQKEVKTLDALKTKFMMLVNHELKTPLTIQRSYLEFLKDTELSEEQSSYLLKSLSGSERLEKLINEILYFLKIQKEDLNSKAEVFKISKVLKNSKPEDYEIQTNRLYFEDALQRLVLNAENHKKEGTQIQIQVSSDEIRISNELKQDLDVNLIVKAFEIHEEAFHHTKGLGLGLPISLMTLSKLGFEVSLYAKDEFRVCIKTSEHRTTQA